MGPTVDLNGRRRHRRSSAPLAAALILGLAVAVGALALPSAGSSAATAVPRNTAEPRISGAAEQGRRLSASRGTWTGRLPLVRVPLGPLRRRRRAPGRKRLRRDLGRDRLDLRPRRRPTSASACASA